MYKHIMLCVWHPRLTWQDWHVLGMCSCTRCVVCWLFLHIHRRWWMMAVCLRLLAWLCYRCCRRSKRHTMVVASCLLCAACIPMTPLVGAVYVLLSVCLSGVDSFRLQQSVYRPAADEDRVCAQRYGRVGGAPQQARSQGCDCRSFVSTAAVCGSHVCFLLEPLDSCFSLPLAPNFLYTGLLCIGVQHHPHLPACAGIRQQLMLLNKCPPPCFVCRICLWRQTVRA